MSNSRSIKISAIYKELFLAVFPVDLVGIIIVAVGVWQHDLSFAPLKALVTYADSVYEMSKHLEIFKCLSENKGCKLARLKPNVF